MSEQDNQGVKPEPVAEPAALVTPPKETTVPAATDQPAGQHQAPVAPEPAAEPPVEAPSKEEPAKPAEEPPTGGEAAGEEPLEDENAPRKGKGLQNRLRDVIRERNELRQVVQGQAPGQPQVPQQPQAPTPGLDLNDPNQARAALGHVDAYVQETGVLPQEITAEEYQHLQLLANGRAQAQQDSSNALTTAVQQLQQERAVEKRATQVKEDIEDAMDRHEVLKQGSEVYNQQFDDDLGDALEEALKENPQLNVRKFIDREVKIHQNAWSQGGETASAGVAKQAAAQALTPTGAARRTSTDPSKMSTSELEAYIRENHGVA